MKKVSNNKSCVIGVKS